MCVAFVVRLMFVTVSYFYYFSCHFSHSNSLKGYKEDEASTPAPAPLLYLEPSPTTPATPQAAVLLPAAREQKVTPVCKDDIDCGHLNLCIAQLTLTSVPVHKRFQIMMFMLYNWIEGKALELIQQDYTTVVDNQLDPFTLDLMLPGPTDHDQVKAFVIDNGMAV
jgi:hypothetical protein